MEPFSDEYKFSMEDDWDDSLATDVLSFVEDQVSGTQYSDEFIDSIFREHDRFSFSDFIDENGRVSEESSDYFNNVGMAPRPSNGVDYPKNLIKLTAGVSAPLTLFTDLDVGLSKKSQLPYGPDVGNLFGGKHQGPQDFENLIDNFDNKKPNISYVPVNYHEAVLSFYDNGGLPTLHDYSTDFSSGYTKNLKGLEIKDREYSMLEFSDDLFPVPEYDY